MVLPDLQDRGQADLAQPEQNGDKTTLHNGKGGAELPLLFLLTLLEKHHLLQA